MPITTTLGLVQRVNSDIVPNGNRLISASIMNDILSGSAYIIDNLSSSLANTITNISASNGLTKSGNQIKLGGTVSEFTTVATTNEFFPLYYSAAGITDYIYFNPFSSTPTINITALSSSAGLITLDINHKNIDYSAFRNNTGSRFLMTTGSTFFESRIYGTGIQYVSNYSASFTTRSLVDKEYVDISVQNATSSFNQYTSSLVNNLSVGYIPFYSGSNVFSSSLIYQTGSKIGINTTTPTEDFQINLGDGRVFGLYTTTGFARMRFTIANTPNLRIDQSTGNGIIISAVGSLSRVGSGNLSIVMTPLGTGSLDLLTGDAIIKSGNLSVNGSGSFVGRVSGSEAINSGEFVTLNQLNQATASAFTFTNGLTATGATVKLGGNLTDPDTTINCNHKEWFPIYNNSGSGVIINQMYFSPFSKSILISALSSSTLYNYIDVHKDQVELYAVKNNTGSRMIFKDSGCYFSSSYIGTGIQYSANYSASFTSRSLVDKAYVDNAITGATGSISGTGVSGRVTYWNGVSSLTSSGELLFTANNSGTLSIGTSNTQGHLNLGGNKAINSSGQGIYFAATTFTDNVTNANETASAYSINLIASPTLTASNNNVYIPGPSTLYVMAPTKGANVNFSKPQSAIFSDGMIYIQGGLFRTITGEVSGTIMDQTRDVVTLNAGGGDVGVHLPDAVSYIDACYTFKRTDATANSCSIWPSGSQTIDGAARYDLVSQYKYVAVISNGANWLIIANN